MIKLTQYAESKFINLSRPTLEVGETGYSGYISIEPHVAVVFHGAGAADELSPEQKAKEQYDSYVKYGRMLEAMLKRLGAKLG